ncbi:MAG: RluA family pseudouridine synthase [bacterium]
MKCYRKSKADERATKPDALNPFRPKGCCYSSAMAACLTYEWTVEDQGERLDKVLAQKCGVSRTQLQVWLKAGLVRCGEHALNAKSRLVVGDKIEIFPPEPQPSHIQPMKLPLDVLYEDKDILVLNKKAGDVVHPGAGARQGTLVSALLYHCKGSLSGIGGVERPGIVHRLDRDTSGVLVVAKNDAAHQALSCQFEERSIIKIYEAYVLGKPRWETGSWTGAIGRHPVHRQKMAVVTKRGREARTDYRALVVGTRASLLELRLYTGRTHQIRVHAAAAGCPVIGDAVYGRAVDWVKQAGVTRQLLHAKKIVFVHPRTNKTVEFVAPVPEDFKKFARFINE